MSDQSMLSMHLEHLVKRQTNINHICANFNNNDTHVEQIFLLFQLPLQSLDLQFSERDNMRGVIHFLFSGCMNQPLERLSLRSMFQRDRQALAQDLRGLRNEISGYPSRPECLHLKAFSLHGFDLNQIFSDLSQMVDFSSLQSLTLTHCTNIDGFIRDVGAALVSTSSALQHVFLEVDTSECLADLLQCSKRLTSAHFSLGERSSQRWKSPWQRLQLNSPILRSLGLHWRQFEHQSGPSQVCGVFPGLNQLANLEELGVQLGEPDLDPANWELSNESDFS